MFSTDNFSGQTLQAALDEQPRLQLSFYSFGLILRKITESGGITEFPVDPDEIARALSAKTVFSTGLMAEDILYVRQDGIRQTVVGFRPRQRTGIWLEGSDEPLRVPLPDLLLIRTASNGKSPDFRLFAVKGRPQTLDEPLYHPPFPNVFDNGGICWGNVRMNTRPVDDTSLSNDWQTLFGTRFGSHAVRHKCRTHPDDVRKILIDLNSNPRRRIYPKSELMSTKKTLADVLGLQEETS